MHMLPEELYFESPFPHGRYLEFSMSEFGHHRCPPGYTAKPFDKQHYLFHYIFSGTGKFITKDKGGETKEYPVNPGEGFMLFQEQNGTYVADEENPWHYAWVKFNGLMVKDLISRAGFDFDNPVYRAKDQAGRDKVAKALTAIVGNAGSPHLELMGRFYMFLSALAESSERHDAMSVESQQDIHLNKAVDFIGQNYNKDIGVQEIADHCDIHRSYLTKIFKHALKVSPQHFLITFRIKRACEFLATGRYSINELCTKVGYPNAVNFTRAFKREVGQTPQQWKKNRRVHQSA